MEVNQRFTLLDFRRKLKVKKSLSESYIYLVYN